MKNCPKCKADFRGKGIPAKDRDLFGDKTHFSRLIGIDGGRLGIYDGILAYRCPDCCHEFPRGDSGWALELFDKYNNSKKRDPDFDPFKF